MKNGEVLFSFRVRFESPEKMYQSYISPYICCYKNKKAVLFQPFESYAFKPPVYGLWSDLDHYLNTPQEISEYFKISIKEAERLVKDLPKYHDATRGVRIIEQSEILKYINEELKKIGMHKINSMDELYGYTEAWWAQREKKA